MRRAWLWCLLCVVVVSPAAGQMREATPPAGVHYLYMVRHGIYDLDTTATDDRVGNGLNALGHEQAKLVGARLAALGIKFDRLISSEYLRAKQTADDMGVPMKMTPTRDGSLNECTPASVNAALMAKQKPGRAEACDSVRTVAWQRYFVPTPTHDTYDVLVCHGNVIRWTLMRALGADTKHWSDQDIGNCSLSIIAVRPDGSIRLAMYSDVGHIPVDKQTWSGKGGGWVRGK
jgi:serine/threonine-protein phosphatase PGAM5